MTTTVAGHAPKTDRLLVKSYMGMRTVSIAADACRLIENVNPWRTANIQHPINHGRASRQLGGVDAVRFRTERPPVAHHNYISRPRSLRLLFSV
jgi:hypothetical protein